MGESLVKKNSSDFLGTEVTAYTACRKLKCSQGEALDFATASYLGYDRSKCVTKYTKKILDEEGFGRCASPVYLNSRHHISLIKRLRELTGFPEVLLFNSNFSANMAAVLHGLPSNSNLMVDKNCHRSLLEALRFGGRKATYYSSHKISCLDRQLKSGINSIITDGVFSMSGLIARIQALHGIVGDGILLVDDAHGFGVYGDNGEGLLSEISPNKRHNVIYTAGFSKALCGAGGFIACSEKVARKIRRFSPYYAFSCSLPLVNTALASYICGELGSEDWRKRISRLSRNWGILNNALIEMDRSLMGDIAPVAVLQINDYQEMVQLCFHLKKQAIIFNAVAFPAIPRGEFRLRFCLSANHTESQMYYLAESLLNAFKKTR